MDRRSFIKGLIALASAPAIGKYVNIFKTEGAREGIEQVASQGVDFFNMVIKKVMDEGTLVKEQDRISTFKHPDRPDITVDVDQTTGSSSVYFDTDEGTKAVGEIQKTMDETTGGKVVEELFEQEEIYGPTGRDAQEGISGGITNLEEFLKMKKGFAAGGRVGMVRGGVPKGLQAALRAIMEKYGKDSIKTVEDTEEFGLPYFNIDRPEKAITRDKFKNFGKEGKFAEDGTPDYDYYAELLNHSEDTVVFGDETIEELEALAKPVREYQEYMYDQYKIGKLDPEPGSKSEARMNLLRRRAEEMEATGDKRLLNPDEMDELAELEATYLNNVDEAYGVDTAMRKELNEMKKLGAPKLSERLELKARYPGISDDLLDKILIDDNPQRKAEVLATLDEAFAMMQKGKGPDEVLRIIKDMNRTKQADGGSIDGEVSLTVIKIPDISESGVESLFKRR